MTWPMVALGEVAEINPRMPPSLDEADTASFLPMAAVSENGQVDYEEERQIGDVKKGYTYFARNDVLLAKITPCFENGKAAVADSLKHPVGFGSTEFHVVRGTDRLHPQYAFHLLWGPNFRELGTKNMTGSAGQKRVPKGLLERLQIPLPPLDEQRRIAGILDQADALRRKRRDALALLDTLTQSIFVEMFGDPVSNPKGLQTIELGELIKVSSGKGLTAKNMRGGDYPVYGGNGINGWHNQGDYPAGTIVIGRVGVYCGAVHITNQSAWVTDNALAITKKCDTETDYLADAIMYADLNQYAGRAAQPLISGNRIYPVKILKPDIEVQRMYTKAKTELRSRTSIMVDNQEQLDSLFASLQSRAFSGKL